MITAEIAAPPSPPAREKSLWYYLRTALSLAVLLLVIGAGMVLIVLPKVAGAIPRTVLTQSMEPTLPPGTLIVVRPVKPDQVAVGDVVTYQITSGRPDVITHRVIAIQFSPNGTRTFTFKGDNNAVADANQVKEGQIIGRLWYSVPKIGYLSLWLNGDARGVIVPVLAGLLFVFAAYMFISGLVSAIRGRRLAHGTVAEQDAAGASSPGVPLDPAPIEASPHHAAPGGAPRSTVPGAVVVTVAVGLLLCVAAYLIVTRGAARTIRMNRGRSQRR